MLQFRAFFNLKLSCLKLQVYHYPKALKSFRVWKYTSKDKCKFFDIAKGSALECSACLDILFVKGVIGEREVEESKLLLKDIVNMLYGLIKSNSDRVYEGAIPYGVDQDQDQNHDQDLNHEEMENK